MPDMHYVDSSNVEAVGYDSNSRELHVQFLSGGYYVYHDVPQDVYDDLLASPSIGSFLNRVVKPSYQYTKQ